jgi:hypothetical protein
LADLFKEVTEMPELMRHTRVESSRLANGVTGISGFWILDTVAGTSSYDMWDVNGCPFNEIIVIGASLIVNSVGAGDTVVVQHVSVAAAANAITDTANLALFAQDDFVGFSDLNTFATDYTTITKGQNLRVVTASGALARVLVEYVIVAS